MRSQILREGSLSGSVPPALHPLTSRHMASGSVLFRPQTSDAPGGRAFLQPGAGFRPSSPWVHAVMQPAAACAHDHLAAIVPARCSGQPMARSRRGLGRGLRQDHGPGQALIHQAPEQHGRARHGRPLAAARILANGGVVATFLRAGLAHHYEGRGRVVRPWTSGLARRLPSCLAPSTRAST